MIWILTQILTSIITNAKIHNDATRIWCEQQFSDILQEPEISEEQIVMICTYVDTSLNTSLEQMCIESTLISLLKILIHNTCTFFNIYVL